MLNINTNIYFLVRPITSSRIKMKRLQKSSRKSVKKKGKSASQSKVQRAKRNLCFDAPQRRTPRKRLGSTSVTADGTVTPEKNGSLRGMTPNKTHVILAPETPVAKIKRQSDGFVKESPDLATDKAKVKDTPRTQKAMESLR